MIKRPKKMENSQVQQIIQGFTDKVEILKEITNISLQIAKLETYISNEMVHTKEQAKDNTKKIEDQEKVLYGNGSPGLISRLESLESRFTGNYKFFNKFFWAIVIPAIFGLIAFFYSIITNLINKVSN